MTTRTGGTAALGLPHTILACLFDLDGVLTDTASVHAKAWKQTFDELLDGRGDGSCALFDEREDYRRHVDGKPRLDGVRDFLASRGITLHEGDPGDAPGDETVHGVGRPLRSWACHRTSSGCVRPTPRRSDCTRRHGRGCRGVAARVRRRLPALRRGPGGAPAGA